MRTFRRSACLWFAGLLALALGFLPNSARAAAGDLDPTFGSGGTVTWPIAGPSRGTALARQPDGKLVVGGWVLSDGGQDFLLVRYNADGSLDPTFGSNGIVLTDFLGTLDEANAAVLQPDGKIIVAGSMRTPDSDFALMRYNPDGSPDPTFGLGGKVVTGLGGQDAVRGLLIQPDGKIVAAGISYQLQPADAKIALARYTNQGALDFGWNGGRGVIITSLSNGGGQANAVALQQDGKIVVAGSATCGACSNGSDVLLARYDEWGNLDSTFGSGGMVTTNLGGFYDAANGMVIQEDGRIVVAGTAGTLPRLDVAVLRYDPDGGLDAGFGAGGQVIVDISGSDDLAQAVALQPDGKVLVAGEAHSWIDLNPDFALLRFTAQGILDKTFGFDGVVSTGFGGPEARASSMVLQPDGRIVLAGTVGPGLGLARYQAAPPKLPRRGWFPFLWVGASRN